MKNQKGSYISNLQSALKKKDIELMLLGDPDVGALVKYRIPTSSFLLNAAIGGGIPCGRLTEIYGEESNGKSSLVADIMANTQKLGGIAVIIDSEQAFDPKRAAAMGLSVDEVIYSDEPTVEGAFEVIDAVIDNVEKDRFITVVWDSVAASPTRAESEGEFGESKAMAEKPRLLSLGLRRLPKKISDKMAMVFINQVRTKFGVTFGKNYDSTGGYPIRFASSLRLELTKIGQLKSNDKPIGIKCKAYSTKNKTFPPFKTAEYDMLFSGGIDDTNAVLDILVKNQLVETSGAWYSYLPIGKKFMRKEFKNILIELKEEERNSLLQAAIDCL